MNKQLPMIAFALLALTAGVLWLDVYPGAAPGGAPEVLYWYDPMRPDQHFDQPGKSPFMDMQLVPKYATAGSATADSTLVEIDPRMAQNLGMRTAAVTTGRVRQRVRASGSVAVDETRIVAVESRAAGWVETLDVRAVGETVKSGQRLAGIYSPELYAAQQELALAKSLADAALIAAARTRLALLGVEGSGEPRRRVAIRAPQSGVVTELLVRQGAQITPGTPLMMLADLTRVWMFIEVPETQAGWIANGLPAEASLPAVPETLFRGVVDHVYPVLDSGTRTLRARLVFDNPDAALKPGMYAEISVLGGNSEQVTLAPLEALIRTGTRNVVLVAEAEGRYRPVSVVPGAEHGEQIVILEGLEPGMQVVVSGQFLIDSEASLLGAYNRLDATNEAQSPAARMRNMGSGASPDAHESDAAGGSAP